MKRTLYMVGLSAMLAMPLLANGQQTSSPGTSGATGSGTRMEQLEHRRLQEQRGQQAMNQEQVRQAQERLKEAGFDPGPIDGVFGERTKEALREYQKAHALPQTGRLDESTRQRLMAQQMRQPPTGAMPGGRSADEPRPGAGSLGGSSPGR
jgi:peptidoglycan hydrolase-like protein with peptidoglycan-binding domain